MIYKSGSFLLSRQSTCASPETLHFALRHFAESLFQQNLTFVHLSCSLFKFHTKKVKYYIWYTWTLFVFLRFFQTVLQCVIYFLNFLPPTYFPGIYIQYISNFMSLYMQLSRISFSVNIHFTFSKLTLTPFASYASVNFPHHGFNVVIVSPDMHNYLVASKSSV